MSNTPEGYQPDAKEMARAKGNTTEKQEWSSERREKQLEQLQTFVEIVKNEPHIYEEIMAGNRSTHLVRIMAENMKTEDGLVYLTTEELNSQGGGTGNIRVWQKKPKDYESGHFNKGFNPNLVANAYANVEDIRREVEELMEHMDVVAEEDHTPKIPDGYVKGSKLFVLKKKESSKKK